MMMTNAKILSAAPEHVNEELQVHRPRMRVEVSSGSRFLLSLWERLGEGPDFVGIATRLIAMKSVPRAVFPSPSGRGWVRVPTCRDSDRVIFGSVGAECL